MTRFSNFSCSNRPRQFNGPAAGYVLNPVRWHMPVERIEGILNLRRRELDRMRVYMGSRDCLMQFLAEELDDSNAAPCGKCVNCAGRLLRKSTRRNWRGRRSSSSTVRRIPIQPRKRWPAGLADPEMQGNIAADRQARRRAGHCACWGDTGLRRPRAPWQAAGSPFR